MASEVDSSRLKNKLHDVLKTDEDVVPAIATWAKEAKRSYFIAGLIVPITLACALAVGLAYGSWLLAVAALIAGAISILWMFAKAASAFELLITQSARHEATFWQLAPIYARNDKELVQLGLPILRNGFWIMAVAGDSLERKSDGSFGRVDIYKVIPKERADDDHFYYADTYPEALALIEQIIEDEQADY